MENEKTEAVLENMTEDEKKSAIKEATEKLRQAAIDAQAAMAEGKGVLKLDKPIRAGGEDVKELTYDFTELTGLEYAEAMDSDPNQKNIFQITKRQALNLFANAAAKCTRLVDSRDIIERIGTADAITAINLAQLFFSMSSKAGNLHISKK